MTDKPPKKDPDKEKEPIHFVKFHREAPVNDDD